jgi:hypothetical protein
MYTKSGLCKIGWYRADNIDARDLHQLADRQDRYLCLAALDDLANSRRALAGGRRNEADLRFQLGGDAELFGKT